MEKDRGVSPFYKGNLVGEIKAKVDGEEESDELRVGNFGVKFDSKQQVAEQMWGFLRKFSKTNVQN